MITQQFRNVINIRNYSNARKLCAVQVKAEERQTASFHVWKAASTAEREKFFPSYRDWRWKVVTLQQDNARPHVAKPVRTFLGTLEWESGTLLTKIITRMWWFSCEYNKNNSIEFKSVVQVLNDSLLNGKCYWTQTSKKCNFDRGHSNLIPIKRSYATTRNTLYITCIVAIPHEACTLFFITSTSEIQFSRVMISSLPLLKAIDQRRGSTRCRTRSSKRWSGHTQRSS